MQKSRVSEEDEYDDDEGDVDDGKSHVPEPTSGKPALLTPRHGRKAKIWEANVNSCFAKALITIIKISGGRVVSLSSAGAVSSWRKRFVFCNYLSKSSHAETKFVC